MRGGKGGSVVVITTLLSNENVILSRMIKFLFSANTFNGYRLKGIPIKIFKVKLSIFFFALSSVYKYDKIARVNICIYFVIYLFTKIYKSVTAIIIYIKKFIFNL